MSQPKQRDFLYHADPQTVHYTGCIMTQMRLVPNLELTRVSGTHQPPLMCVLYRLRLLALHVR